MNAESTREALDVASLAGDILLASGAEIFRGGDDRPHCAGVWR